MLSGVSAHEHVAQAVTTSNTEAPWEVSSSTPEVAPQPILNQSNVSYMAAVDASAHKTVDAPAAPSAAPKHVTNCVLLVDGKRHLISTEAHSVRELLAQQHVGLSSSDVVSPRLNDAVPKNGITRVQRIHTWVRHEMSRVSAPTIRHKDATLMVGEHRVLHRGHSGMRERVIALRTVDGSRSMRHFVSSRLVKAADPEILAVGTRTTPITPMSEFATTAMDRTEAMAHNAFSMIATAYTAYCSGCSGSGRGATGIRIEHGVVAVDPHIIPLGSHLYIPGYGNAIAGDTGGAIIGHRIDLAMNTLSSAMNFGRRIVTIYLLDTGSHR
jgi:3D (Asp-Asp-Asp) domain-containing protein